MRIDSAINISTAGIQRGLDDARQSAHEVATAVDSENPTDVVHSLVDLKQAELQVAANAKVIGTADKMIGSLLDELA